MDQAPDPELVSRFAADLDALLSPQTKLGVAVSGGPDSLALVLLAESFGREVWWLWRRHVMAQHAVQTPVAARDRVVAAHGIEGVAA